MEDAGVMILLEEDVPDTHSAGVHVEMEWLVVVRRSKDWGRGEESFEVFKSLSTLLCPHEAPLGTRDGC